ncbi:MAG: DNA polymerase III subunit delta' [Patescibacteria group bacterium]|nr:DNA polymerase III subunit delta' [Patescibacteria group bacterium]
MRFNWPIVGHQNIVNFLQKSIENQKIFHAYLFYGPAGLGKKTMAKFFTLSLICSGLEKPCLKCQSCQNFLKNIHPDVIWLRKEEGRKNISIDQIRNIKERLAWTGFTDSYKIVIIVKAEEMTLDAANSFLKILEEPPAKSLIILLANSLKNIPKTIVSRCQLIKFSLVKKEEIAQFLLTRYQLEEEKAREISALSFGWPGRAIKFAEDKKFLNNYLADQKIFIEILEADSLDKRLKIVEKVIKREKIQEMIVNWQILIRDLIILQTKNQKLLVNLSFQHKLKKLIEKFSLEKIYQTEIRLNHLALYLNQNINLKLALDNFVINL